MIKLYEYHNLCLNWHWPPKSTFEMFLNCNYVKTVPTLKLMSQQMIHNICFNKGILFVRLKGWSGESTPKCGNKYEVNKISEIEHLNFCVFAFWRGWKSSNLHTVFDHCVRSLINGIIKLIIYQYWPCFSWTTSMMYATCTWDLG